MADFRTRLQLDGSDFNKTLNDAGKSVEDFAKKTDGASKQVNDMGNATKRTASELLKQMKSMEGGSRSMSNYRQQLSQMQRQLADLTINYRAMSDEMKQSDFGREVASQIDALKAKAAEFRDTIGDVQNSITKLSSDTVHLDALKMGFEGVGAAMSLVASTGMLGAETQEELIRVMARLQAIQAATNSVIKIANVLNKDSIFMLKMKDLWAKLSTRSQIANTAATKGATAAQKALNLAMKANPYILAATAITGLIIALVKLSKHARETREQEEQMAAAAEKAAEKFNTYKTKIGDAVGSVIGKFKVLQAQYSRLQTSGDKQEWINNNANAFKDLGLKVNDVNDADKVLIEQSEDVISALRARAAALAMQDMYMDSFKKQAEAEVESVKMVEDAAKKARESYGVGSRHMTSTGAIPEHLAAAGLSEEAGDLKYVWGGGQSGAGFWEMTEQGAVKMFNHVIKMAEENGQAMIADAKKESDQVFDIWERALDDYTKKSDKVKPFMTKPGETKPSSVTAPTKEEDKELNPESLDYWNKQVQDLQKQLNSMSPKDAQFDDVLKELDTAQQKVMQIKEMMKIPEKDKLQLIPPTENLTLKQAADMVALIQTRLKETVPDTKTYNELATALKLWQDELDKIQAKYDAIAGKKDKVDSDTNVSSMTDSVSSTISSMSALNSSVRSIYDTIDGLGDSWDKSTKPIEKMTDSLSAVFSILQSICTIFETMNKLNEAFNLIEAISLNMQRKKTQEKMKQTGLNAANLALEEQEAVASATKAAGEAASSASKIPGIGWIAAIGAVAAIIAAISSAKSSVKFAKGGIVPGSSFSGDNIIAGLNSGEMVLTTQQQTRLFNILDGKGSVGGGKVEFVIKGQELKGVLENYNKKMSRI